MTFQGALILISFSALIYVSYNLWVMLCSKLTKDESANSRTSTACQHRILDAGEFAYKCRECGEVVKWVSVFYLLLVLPSLMAAQPPNGQLMDAERLAAFRKMIPRLTNDALERRLRDPSTIIYTEHEMPRVFQMDGEFIDTRINVAAIKDFTGGNAKQNYPWRTTAGVQFCGPEVKTFKLLSLPAGKPLVIFPDREPQYFANEVPGHRWVFPVGTLVAEVLYQTGPDGYDYPFEVRTRSRAIDKWNADVFRPFPTATELLKGIERINPAWRREQAMVDLYWQLRSPLKTVAIKRQDRFTGKVFAAEAKEERLPPLPPKLVARLLTETPFQSVLGVPWRGEEDTSPAAPTANGFNIVPRNYAAGFVSVDNQSCMKCHETTMRHARTFGPALEWYGFTSGSDGIFSVDPRKLRALGLVENYDARKHPASVYAAIEGVR